MLWAPKVGAIHGTFGLTKAGANRRWRDRRANGEAFPGERPRIMRVQIAVRHDGAVEGYLLNGPVLP